MSRGGEEGLCNNPIALRMTEFFVLFLLISDNIAFSVVRIAQGYAIVSKWVDLIRDFDMRNLANRAINGKNSVFRRANNALVIAGNIKIRIRNGRICVNGKFLPAGFINYIIIAKIAV